MMWKRLLAQICCFLHSNYNILHLKKWCIYNVNTTHGVLRLNSKWNKLGFVTQQCDGRLLLYKKHLLLIFEERSVRLTSGIISWMVRGREKAFFPLAFPFPCLWGLGWTGTAHFLSCSEWIKAGWRYKIGFMFKRRVLTQTCKNTSIVAAPTPTNYPPFALFGGLLLWSFMLCVSVPLSWNILSTSTTEHEYFIMAIK